MGLVTIDGWLKLTAPAQTAVLFKELRLTLHSILKELIRKPEVQVMLLNLTLIEPDKFQKWLVFFFFLTAQNVDIASNKVVSSMIHLLLEEDKPPA